MITGIIAYDILARINGKVHDNPVLSRILLNAMEEILELEGTE